MMIPSALLVAAAVSSSGALTRDMRQFGSILDQTRLEQQQQQTDGTDEAGSDFFPVSGSGATFGDDRFSEFVTVDWQGMPIPLRDVPRTAWFAPYVSDLVTANILSGYRDAAGKPTGEYAPDRSVSVEEVAKIVLAAVKMNIDLCPDMSRNWSARTRWSVRYVACAEAEEFGVYADATMDVSRPMLRGEVVETVLEAFKVDAGASSSAFSDVSAASPFAPFIRKAAQDGIVSGYRTPDGTLTGTFGPGNPVTRAEMAKIIRTAIKLYSSGLAL